MACKYKGCNEPVNSPVDNEYCVFHAPKEYKGITVEEFNKLIFEKINKAVQGRESGIFRGYIFPGDISFNTLEIPVHLDFGDALFCCRVHFTNCIFRDFMDFSYCVFQHKVAFTNVTFGDLVQFNFAKFSCDKESRYDGTNMTIFNHTIFEKVAIFHRSEFFTPARFIGGEFKSIADFSYAQFKNQGQFPATIFKGKANFSNAIFDKPMEFNDSIFNSEVSFRGTIFKNKAEFIKTEFKGELDCHDTEFHNIADFWLARFNNNVNFVENLIKNKISFRGIKFSENVVFYFQRPIFKEEDYNNILINFERVRFNPFAAHFEGIKIGNSKKHDDKNKPIVIFRYCQLKDTYFTNSNIILFSFYKSSFDQARFISCRWGENKDTIPIIPYIKNKTYDRKNIIREEELFDEIKKLESDGEKKRKLIEDYQIEDLSRREDIAALYRRMKTALDNTKDYQQASWFYFNEFEMKRRHLEEQIENSKPKWKIFRWQPCIWLNHQRKKIFSRYGLHP